MATIRWCPIAPKWDIYQPLGQTMADSYGPNLCSGNGDFQNLQLNAPPAMMPIKNAWDRWANVAKISFAQWTVWSN